MTIRRRSCRAPDWTTRVLFKCPCGDQPVSIITQRQEETYLDGAYWCSTVMALLDFDGSTKYVWNPFSLAELKRMLSTSAGDFDAYLDCVASKNDGSCVAPTHAVFEQQQIPMVSVYQRCLSNYQENTWDQGSFVMFNQTLQGILRLDTVMPSNGIADTFGVSNCLLKQKALGNDNVGCLTDYFLKGTQAGVYFAYSNITSTDSPGSDLIDACLTFSGPAKSQNPAVSKPFKACLENSADRTGCDIPHMLWSGRSTNRVSVATQHVLNISDPVKRKQLAQGTMDEIQARVLSVLDELSNYTGDGLKITIFSSEGDLLHQYADCVMQGPMGSMTLTPGPSMVEKVIWSRKSSGEPSRQFELPCTGGRLANRDGTRDNVPPFTCGTYARRAVIKHFLRRSYGGGMTDNDAAREAVVTKVRQLINATREAWSFQGNFLCTCPNGSSTGWECCMQQLNCATEPCPCPDGYEVPASVACCQSVCSGLGGSGLKAPFSYIDGASLAENLLKGIGTYMQNDIWTSNDPWLVYDPHGAEAYKESWTRASFKVADAGLFDASKPVVYYDEAKYPFQSTFWEFCTGLLQQVIWTMPIDRATGKPKGLPNPFDPIHGRSHTLNLTYVEDFIRALTTEAYKSSPVYWHYNVRHTPSQSEMCRRTTPRPPDAVSSFPIAGQTAAQLGFSAMTLGGLGGADCYCGWWNGSSCRIPDSLCASLEVILGFTRICKTQRQMYNASDHRTVLAAIEALLKLQPSTAYPCPALRISEHWGFIDNATGRAYQNATSMVLNEGVGGFRVGNVDWLFATQAQLVNARTRVDQAETPDLSVALECNKTANPAIADHFIDDLFPSAQGVRQSMPQSYCVRYGIELARLTAYQAAGLKNAASQQQGTVDKWRMRCQYKLEELAVCNSFKVYSAAGGPTSTAKCPFALSVVTALRGSYAVTPGCLLLLWNTPNRQQDGIYDPCICVSCASTPNIDVPAQLTSVCRLESFQLLVANDVVPGETTAGVPLGSGSFTSLLTKPGLLQINSPPLQPGGSLPDITHWALQTAIMDADKVLDWWPDAWRHPVGFHVTPGCSRPKDARWKTFDASWRWDSQTEQMVYARDETNDPLLSRNAFGASGVCRANNYGMPLTTLNSMAVCTKENANAYADPMVPNGGSAQAWADGAVNCAPDAASTPWAVDRTVNPPRQWTVGTLQREAALAPLPATEWGPGCGPYPLQTCASSSDCAAGLACVLVGTATKGVCGYMQPGKFECASHAQCGGDLMCAGDGLCVQGVWQVKNDIEDPVSFRSYSQECATGNPLDTWGTSIAEKLPDILNASGLCSYRSWFENRRMSSRNQCNTSAACQDVSGSWPWNFSAPDRRADSARSAFESRVLLLQPHPCDRDYQFYEGFSSCTPNDNYATVFNADGNPLAGPHARDNRTITYRADGLRLPLIHYMDQVQGPSFGFTGVPMTYRGLKLGTSSPSIVSCASQKMCSLQPVFKVNNVEVDHRLVLDGNRQRGYTVGDLLKCGVFGFIVTSAETTTCQLDYAVAPLAFYIKSNADYMPDFPSDIKSTLQHVMYTPDQSKAILSTLQQLPDAMLQYYIGGPPTTLQDYVYKAALFVTLHGEMDQIKRPTYPDGSIPRQLYNLTMYGAYEVPFAWWFRCGWLSGKAMTSTVPINDCQVQNPESSNASQPTGFASADPRLSALFGETPGRQDAVRNTSLLRQLTSLPGIITQEILDQAAADYAAERNTWIQRLGRKMSAAQKKCYIAKRYNMNYSALSQRYQLNMIKQANGAFLFDLTQPYVDDRTNATLCNGADCLSSDGYSIPTKSNSDFCGTFISKLTEAKVGTNTVTLRNRIVPLIAGKVVLSTLFTSEQVDPSFWSDLTSAFQNLPNNCNQPTTRLSNPADSACLCETWESCSGQVQTMILERAGMTSQPQNTQAANVIMDNAQIDVCSQGLLNTDGCFLDLGQLGGVPINFTNVSSVSLPIGVNAELYMDKKWSCVALTCTGPLSNVNMVPIPPDQKPPGTVTTRERVVVDEYSFDQRMGIEKVNPWNDLKTQNDEIQCGQNFYRFHWMSQGRNFGCVQTCSVQMRSVTNLMEVELVARSVSYYVNDQLVSQFETYPCFQSASGKHVNILTGRRESLISDDQVTRNLLNLRLNEAYRPVFAQSVIGMCDYDIYFETDSGLPKPGSFNFIRSNLMDPSTLEIGSLGRIMHIVGTINANSDKNTLQRRPFTFEEEQAKCSVLKGDPFLGCIMWPGEHMQPGVGTGFHCKPQKYVKYYQPMFSTCMQDFAEDRCTSIDQVITRRMALRGQSILYNFITTTPLCTAGPPKQCSLKDEIVNWQNSIYACPGTNRSTDRYRGYIRVQASDRTHTDVLLYQSLSWKTEPSITGMEGFDHIFLGLSPGFHCGNQAPASCRGSYTAVEMRRNLWLCMECPMITSTQCTGTHDCRIVSPGINQNQLDPLPGWDRLSSAQRLFLTQRDSTIDVAIPAVQWLSQQVLSLWTSGVSLSYEVPDFMKSFSGSYSFNPTSILAFDSAMQVNAKSCTLTAQLPDFANCSFDGHRRDLKQFVSTNYKTPDGLIIQPGHTLQWQVGRAQMTLQNIPQWESTTKRSGLFLDDLFNDKWCMKGNVVDNACLVTFGPNNAPIIKVLNPGLLGTFEPSVGCDTAIINQQRVTYSYCQDCADQQEYTRLEYEGGDAYFMQCPTTYQAVQQVTVDESAASNLCSKTPYSFEGLPSKCNNQRGTLNGAYEGSPRDSLYTRVQWTSGQPTGMGQNPLLRGAAPLAGVPPSLSLSSSDIGGHFVRMVLGTTRDGASMLSVQGLPLSSYASATSPAAYGLGVLSSSPRWAQIDTAAETFRLATTYPNSVCAAWDCPLRRRAFYMGTDAKFRPSVPDPMRTRVLYGTRAHPTQAAHTMPTTIDRTSSRVLGVYNTSNGFCACMTASCAAACASDVQALYGTWTSSSVLPAASPCVEQLDWPYAGGPLRDGAPFDQRWTTVTPCGILDRLPTFQYTYTNRKATTQASSSRTTLDKGGVCHMGWPAVTAGPLAGCYLLVETDTYMCPWFLSPKNVTRLRAKTVEELLDSPTRPQLSDCSAPPGYEINGTIPTAPEVSYGQLKRWEASRLLASDLRRQLCGNSTVCEPSSQWTLPTFWSKVYMANFPPIPSGNGADDALWSRPWVLCDQTAANGSQTCDGTIPRSSWATGNRPQLCLDAVQRSPLSKNLSQNVNVCDLDSTLDLFCRTIQDARYGVFEANCLYSGQCSPKLFFYQPSTYAVDNGEFVRQTVQSFYNGTVEGACIPDQDTAAAIKANAQDLAHCPAMQLNVLIDCIQIVRVIVGSLVEMWYYCGQLMLKVFQLLGANKQEEKSIITEINAMLALIKNKFIVLFKEIGDLFYKILFDGPMGSWLITMIQAVCNFLEWLFSDVVYLVLCWVQTVSVWFLQNIATGFINVLNGISFGRLGYLQNDISRAVTSIQENIPCTPQKFWSCNLPFSDAAEPTAILPMPTRCWAGAQPEIGGSLACSAADTCIQQSDFTHVICGACPAASSMIKFGCDSLTKLCTCNVFPVGISSCVTHQECMLDDSSVDCQYVDSYLMPSYGNVPCNRCPKPICLITDGSGVGKCSCLLKPVPSQTCTGVGQRVSPDAQDLCLVSSSSSGLGGNNMYSVTYRTLASVPCMLLNQAQTYCMTVITSGVVSTQLVVGLALLSTRRRQLLQAWETNESNATELLGMTAFQANVTQDIWGGRGEPCRSLVLADASRLGILELYARSECWRWYEIGVRLTIEANMTEVSPFLLVTWRDLADAMLERRSLVEIMAKLPSLIHRLLLHSELSQPAYLLIMYWSGIVPREVWANQTVLDEAKAFLYNASAGPSPTGRRLLSQDERPQRRLQQSVIDTTVSSQTAYEWGQGPYSWPPNFVYWNGEKSCAVVSEAIDVVKNGLDSTITYYQRATPDPLPASWPSFPVKSISSASSETALSKLGSIDFSSLEAASSSARYVLSNLTDVWLDRDKVKEFVKEAPYMSTLKSFFSCNFKRIQTCEDRRPLFWSVLQTAFVVLMLGIAAKLVEIPYIDILLALCFVPLLLFVTYGYSPTCAPVIPTCILSDVFSLIDWLLPPNVQWPDPLTTKPNCAETSCLKSCTDDPVVGYSSFYAHAAWIMCEMDQKWALDTALALTQGDPVRTAVLVKCSDHTSQMRSAQRICFSMTIVNSLPLILLGLAALWIVPSVLSMAAAAAQSAVTLFFTFVLFVHSHEE